MKLSIVHCKRLLRTHDKRWEHGKHSRIASQEGTVKSSQQFGLGTQGHMTASRSFSTKVLRITRSENYFQKVEILLVSMKFRHYGLFSQFPIEMRT